MGAEQSQPDIFGPPIKDILSPQKGTLYSNAILKRTIQVHEEEFTKKLMNFFKIKKQRMNSPVYLKVHCIQVDNESLLCGTSKLIHIFVDYPEMTLSNEIRKKRINQLPFTSTQLRETYDLLLDALALYQELGIYYHNLSIDTVYFDRNVKIMDPYIFDLKASPLRHYRDPQNQISYQNLVWSFGVILLEMYHLQPVPQIYREQYVDWNQISKLILAIQNEAWLSHILSIIFQEYRPNFLELRQIPLDMVTQQQQQQQQQKQQQQDNKIVGSQPSYQSLVQPTIKLLKIPCEGRGSLKERIESIKANYFPQSYTYRESAEKNYDSRSTISVQNFKEEMSQRPNQTVDLKSDPFMKDRESDLNTISKADQNEEYICETYADGAIYEGFKKNFLKNGQGSLYYADSSFYIGQWKNDKINGFGSLYYPSGKLAYQGFWVDEKFHGKGIVFNENPKEKSINYKNFNQIGEGWISYSGMFANDQKHGKGVMTFTNGDRFEGGFVQGQISGAGQYKESNGNEIKGIWRQNLFI